MAPSAAPAANECGGCRVPRQGSCGRAGGVVETEVSPFPGQALYCVYPPWLSCCPEPGPGPHSCGDALGLLAGTGEREGHRVLTGLRAFWGQRLVGMKPVEVQRALLEAEATPLPGAIVTSLCVVGQITLLGIAIPRH